MRLREFSRALHLSPPLYKFAFALLLVGLAFALTYTEAANTFSSYDVKAILLLGTAVNVPLLAGPLFLPRRFKLKLIANATLSLVALASGATAYIVIHTDLYAPGNRLNLITVCIAALFVLLVFFRVIDQQRWGIANATLSLVVLASGATAYIIHTDLYAPENRLNLITVYIAALFVLFVSFRVIDQQHWGGITLAAVALIGLSIVLGGHFLERYHSTRPMAVDMSNIQQVAFRQKPNLYFISFESLVPRSLLKKHYGLDTSRFHDLFEVNFRRFPNFFSEDSYTTASLNAILALDKGMFIKAPFEYSHNLFSGVQPSPLLGILRDNGYETTSYFPHSALLGGHKGPYIDHYIKHNEVGICSLLDTEIQSIAFWGYCILPREARQRSPVEYLRKLTANERPQFLMAHIGVPGHVGGSFRYDDRVQRNTEIRRYAQRLNGEAIRYLETILEHLKNHDPDAILYVYGDHGPWLSRGVSLEDNPTFVVQDRLGVLGGVYPPDACATYFDETLSKGYITALDGVHAILHCLSGGQSALKTPREPDIGTIHGITGKHKEFLYE